ncbi:MAG: alpha/beta fold hydrolase [Saccharospirillum sp.]
MKHTVREERLKVATVQGGQLFVHHLEPERPKGVVVMVHGLGSSAQAFLGTEQGLAPYLAEMGYRCLVVDLIGHGQSWPLPSRKLQHGLSTVINEDIPRLVTQARRLAKGQGMFLMGQGIGGALLASAYAVQPSVRPGVVGMVHFGTGRAIARQTGVSAFVWHRLMPALGALRGQVPLNWLGLAQEAENPCFYRDFLNWTKTPWVDPDAPDVHFSEPARTLNWPPGLYFARKHGGYADQLSDVRAFIRTIGTHNARLLVLGRREGNLRNYRFSQLTRHEDAWVDHFPLLLDWLNEHCHDVDTDKGEPRLKLVSGQDALKG